MTDNGTANVFSCLFQVMDFLGHIHNIDEVPREDISVGMFPYTSAYLTRS